MPTANTRIIAHTGARQLIKAGHSAGARQKPIGRVFGIKPHFNRMTAQRDIFLRHAQPIAFRHFYLQGHQIETGHFFRHRMLDLQPRIHFEKIETAIGIKQKLNRACAAIMYRLGGIDRRLAHSGA